MQNSTESIGDKIKALIDERKISQVQLSVDTKIATPKLNLILTGKRRLKLEELEVICWALKEPVETFLTPKPPQKITQKIGA